MSSLSHLTLPEPKLPVKRRARKAKPPLNLGGWVPVIQAIATAIVLIITTWNKVEQSSLVTIVDKVKTQTDGLTTASLVVASNAARKTADATGNLSDAVISKEADEALRVKKEADEKSSEKK